MNLSIRPCLLTVLQFSVFSGTLIWGGTSCGTPDLGTHSPGGFPANQGSELPRLYLQKAEINTTNAKEVLIQGYRYTHPLSVKWIVAELIRVQAKRKEHDHKYVMSMVVVAENGAQVDFPFYLRSAGGPGDTCCLGVGGYRLTPILRDFVNWSLHTTWGQGTAEQKVSDKWKGKVAMTLDEIRSGFSPPQPGVASDAERGRYIRLHIELCRNLMDDGSPDQDTRGTALRYLFNDFLDLGDYKSTQRYLQEYVDLYQGDKRPLDAYPLMTREEWTLRASLEVRQEILRKQGKWREGEKLARHRLNIAIQEWNRFVSRPELSTNDKARMYRNIHLYLPLDIAENLEGQVRYSEALRIYEKLQREWREARSFRELIATLGKSDPIVERIPQDQQLVSVGLARCRGKVIAQRKNSTGRTALPKKATGVDHHLLVHLG